MVDSDKGLEDPCPSCGAMVRRGLVRCWSCGSFMRPDVAAAYERMQNRAPEVEFKPLPEHRVTGQGGPAGQVRHGAASATDDDFEVGEMNEASDSEFELSSSFSEPVKRERAAGASAFTGRKREETQEATDREAKNDVQPAPAAEAAPAGDSAKDPAAAPAAPEVPHSEATAGDVLLQVALQEERELERRGGRRRKGFDPVRVADGWMITCPCPARVRIKVKETHRGKTGKCPNPSCGSYFTVPADLPMDEPQAAPAGESAAVPESAGFPADPADKAGAYTHWLRDVRLHIVKPAKAKRKPGGHEKEFQPADVAFSKSAGIAVIGLAVKPAGLLGKAKKPEQVREDVLTELRDGKPVAELSPTTKFSFETDTLGKLIVEYPPAYEHESTFAGIPVFGEGRIAVKLPPAGAPDEQHFISITLTQYRRLKELLEGLFEIQQFGLGCRIPSEDDFVTLVCHYSEDTLTVLRDPKFHLADPETPLEPIGYRCESCGLIVSENSRKKEKIGGLEGKKLASAKCPKCKGKFGKSPFYALKPKEEKPAEDAKSGAKSDEEKPAEETPATEAKAEST